MRLTTLLSRTLPFLAIIVFTTGSLFLYANVQPHLGRTNFTIDSVQYLILFEHFRNGGPIDALVHPFNTRPLVPFLASLVPLRDASQCFFIVNIVFINAFFLLMWHVLATRLNIKKSAVVIGFSWLVLHWGGIIRVYVYCPILVDTPVYFLQAILLYIVVIKRYRWLIPMSAIAVLAKDVFLIHFCAILIYIIVSKVIVRNGPSSEPIDRELLPLIIASLLVSIAIRWLVVHNFPSSTPHHSYLTTILLWAKHRFDNPLSFVRWMSSMAIAYGAFTVLAFARLASRPLSHTIWIIISLAFASTIASLGTSNMLRIVFLAYPFVITTILVLLQKEKLFIMLSAFVAGLPLLRLTSLIPLPTTPSAEATIEVLRPWSPEWANLPTVNAWILYVLVASAFVLWLRHATSRRVDPSSN